jgi:TPR repeat protein
MKSRPPENDDHKQRSIADYEASMDAAFTGICTIVAILSIMPIIWALFAPMLLGYGIIFSLPSFMALTVYRKIHWKSAFISIVSFGLLLLIYFVPVWVISFRAVSPQDNLRAGDAYCNRGQLLGNNSKAWQHYLIAANGGDSEAQSRVGEAYLYGHYGIRRDRELARHWLSTAAHNGHSRAATVLKDVDSVP